ncbi:hypothetical protein OG216_09725 [Streptomycetaceae bacterium NBC_01309]
MAPVVYASAKAKFLTAGLNLSTLNIKAVLVDTGQYTFSAAHDFLDDVPSGARVATSGNLASKTTTGGVFDAADITISAVTGATVEAVIVYNDSGSAATSDLIAFIDSASSGLPFTPNGGDCTISWDSGASKIFAL